MARSYGQIMSAIWNDADFRALSASAQRVYLMLVTQADISSAGTLPLTMRRWARYASDTDMDTLSEDVSELASARFVVVDFDTEELLVRKFVKWDGGYGNKPRRLAIVTAAHAVVSQRIRGVLGAELSKLGIEHDLPEAPYEGACQAPYEAPRVVVTEVSTSHNPEPEPETTTRNPSANADAAISRPDVERLCTLLADLIEGNGSKRPTVTDRWRRAARLLIDVDHREPAAIERAIRWCQADEFWRSNVLSMPKLREQYDRLRLAAQRGAGPPRSTTDTRVMGGLDLAAGLRARETATGRELTDGRLTG